MKKTYSPFYLAVFLMLVGLISAGILGGINMLTAEPIRIQQEKAVQERLAKVGVNNAIVVEELDTLVEGVVSIYQGIYDEDQVVYAFVTENRNSFTTVSVIVVIDDENGSLLNIDVGPNPTTHGYDKQFQGNKFGVIDSNVNNYQDNFVTVTGATFSSMSVQTCIGNAFQQYDVLKGAA